MFHLKIKLAVVALLLMVFIIISSTMLYFQYKSSNDYALLSVGTAFNNAVEKSIDIIKSYNKSSNDFINTVENIKDIDTNIEVSKQHVLLPVITNYINTQHHVYGIYLGLADESFYIVYNVDLSKKMRETLNAPKDARWLVKKNKKEDEKILSTKIFLDEKLKILKTQEEYTQYKPTQRLWYKEAIKSDTIIKTQPYVFSALQELGVTYAKKINSQKGTVLSVDITLGTLSKLLEKQNLSKGSSAFLYKRDGTLLGYSNKITKDEHLKNVKDILPNVIIKNDKVMNLNKQVYVTIDDKEYIKYTKKIDIDYQSEDYLTVLSPIKPIMQPYMEDIYNTLFFNLMVGILLIIIFVYLSTKVLVNPILKLKEESNKIKNKEYDDMQHVDSFFTEISELSNSFVNMADSIKEKTLNNEKLIDIAYKISSEENYDLLLEKVLLGAKELSNSDGGTLYIFNEEENALEYKMALNTSLNINLHSESVKNWPKLKLYDEDGKPNNKNISVVSALEDKLICIDDIYESDEYEFTGVKVFDKNNDYKTTSMLVIPIKDRDGDLVGVIQLINKIVEDKVLPFNDADKALIKSMASISSMVLHNRKLVQDLENMLYGLISSIGTALGEKSGYTGKHVDKVAELSLLIANAINDDDTTFKDVNFSKEYIEEVKLGAWLHDIGKITTPEYVVDKATRLETIHDRIDFVAAKIEIAKRDVKLEYLENKIDEKTFNDTVKLLEEDLEFIAILNKGGEFMSAENKSRLDDILNRQDIIINNQPQKLLNDNEYYNLSIQKGTLTDEERDVINKHVVVSYEMLKKVNFPKRLSNVATLAGSHHKTIDGKGYAHEDIKDLEMTIGDKILAVADIFEALSAHDRPYRGPNKLSEVVKILKFMVKDKHIDQDIVRFIIEKKIYQEYVDKYFLDDQIDEVDIDFDEISYGK